MLSSKLGRQSDSPSYVCCSLHSKKFKNSPMFFWVIIPFDEKNICPNSVLGQISVTKQLEKLVKMLVLILDYIVSLIVTKGPQKYFNLESWAEANPSFYVSPHPGVYSVYGDHFLSLFVTVINLVYPKYLSDCVHVLILILRLALKPFYSPALDNFWFRKVLPAKAIVTLSFGLHWLVAAWSWTRFKRILSMIRIPLSDRDVLFWALNFLNFGFLASWPLLRPDYFEAGKPLYCPIGGCQQNYAIN